jgi:enamine deaminase RidA (YjgF/YER057c/UK114 family)
MEKIQPADVFDPRTYAQCVRSGNTLFLSGQVAVNREGRVISGGTREQAEFVWRQIGTILRAAGAGYGNIVKMTTYLTNIADREVSMAVRKQFLGEHVAASTLVAVSALARPEYLIEVEVTAVLE